MTLSGSRGLIRVSQNPQCELQAAMAVEGVREPEFFRAVTGTPYPKEYGERLSARRRGSKFEASLLENDAARLRNAVGEAFGRDPATLTVRNFQDELPGSEAFPRLARTRRILRDLIAGQPVPDIVVQAQLTLAPPAGRPWPVRPDLLVLHPATGLYVPGEMKSFIVRQGVGDPGDLNGTRRQIAVYILALRSEMARVSPGIDIRASGLLQFATPFGLSPARPVIEDLSAAVADVERALAVVQRVQAKLNALREVDQAPLPMLFDEFGINFQDSCHSSCVMAAVCKGRVGAAARSLGDSVARSVGADADIARMLDLMHGAQPDTAVEAELAASLRAAAVDLGLDLASDWRAA